MGQAAARLRTRLPNLLVAGVTKAGTTSLFRYLAQHPDVCPSDVKELRYFSPARYGEPLPPLEDYACHFAHHRGEAYAMEATPGYFYGGSSVARSVRAVLPDVRVLVCLREPGERCWSWFNFVRSRARVPKTMTFEEYLDRCEELHAAGTDDTRDNQPFWGLGGGCYARWVDDWSDLLGPAFTVVFFDDLVADPATTTARLCAWLGVDAAAAAGFRYDVENRTEQYRSREVQQLALLLNRSADRFFERHRTTKRQLRRAYYLLNRDPDDGTMSAAARARLTAFYRPYNADLARRLVAAGHTRLPPWLAPHAP